MAFPWEGTSSQCPWLLLRNIPYGLRPEADDYTYEALKLFLLGAISRAFQPGCKFEIMLCLVGGQGAGKSTFFRLLAVRDEWFSDDLRKLDDDKLYRIKLEADYLAKLAFDGAKKLYGDPLSDEVRNVWSLSCTS